MYIQMVNEVTRAMNEIFDYYGIHLKNNKVDSFCTDSEDQHEMINLFGMRETILGMPRSDEWKKDLNFFTKSIGSYEDIYVEKDGKFAIYNTRESEKRYVIRYSENNFDLNKIIQQFHDGYNICGVNIWSKSTYGASHRFTKIDIPKESIDKDIYPDIKIENLANEFMESKDSILILNGKPGTGKSTFLKYIIKNFHTKRKIAYTKDIEVMKMDDFWQRTSSNIILLDDYDLPLDERNEVTSNILSSASGIFEDFPKVIITTNQNITSIDSAILRPGRCFDVIEMKGMSRSVAKDIWLNKYSQNEQDFDKLFVAKATNITAADLMTNIHREKKSRGYWRDGIKHYNIQDVYKPSQSEGVGFGN